MANLTFSEQAKLEKLLDMNSGYVLEFSNRTFQLFIAESININIYDSKYEVGGESKARRLRTFWDIEKPSIVGKLLFSLIKQWEDNKVLKGEDITPQESRLAADCKEIAEALVNKGEVDDIDALTPITKSKDHFKLFQEIKEIINRNEPEKAMDRLHTYMVHFFRELCVKYQINYDKDTPLHALYGNYIKMALQEVKTQSELSEKIIKSPITLLDKFNFVRNNQSYAHSIHILSKPEAYLIVSNMVNTIRFIKYLEEEIAQKSNEKNVEIDSMPTDEEIEAAGDWWMQMHLDIKRGK